MMGLKIYPQFQHYDGTTGFTSFICSNDDDSYVSADDVEWLYPNFTIMTSTLNFRIDGIVFDLFFNINVTTVMCVPYVSTYVLGI